MRLKSPGTVKISETPAWTRRRAKCRPRVASEDPTAIAEAGTESWSVATAPFGGLPTLPFVGLHESMDPILVSIRITEKEKGKGLVCWRLYCVCVCVYV